MAYGYRGRALYGRVRLLTDDPRVFVERRFERFPVVASLPPVPGGRDGDRRHHGVCLPSGVLDSSARRGRRCPARSVLRIRRRSQQPGLGDPQRTNWPRPRHERGRGHSLLKGACIFFVHGE